jgi:hypothetical protein
MLSAISGFSKGGLRKVVTVEKGTDVGGRVVGAGEKAAPAAAAAAAAPRPAVGGGGGGGGTLADAIKARAAARQAKG